MDHRQERMNNLIIKTFYECLEEEDFSQVTVGKIAEKALINRSSFYRYYTDKYALRDAVVDAIVQDFAEHMDCLLYTSTRYISIKRAAQANDVGILKVYS